MLAHHMSVEVRLFTEGSLMCTAQHGTKQRLLMDIADVLPKL